MLVSALSDTVANMFESYVMPAPQTVAGL